MKRPSITLPPIEPRWNDGRTVIVAAPGPSLTADVAERCKGFTVLAIKEAYRLLPWAEVLYGCDAKFWKRENGCPDYQGERWSSHDDNSNHKVAVARDYGVKLVAGNGLKTFSLDPKQIHYGNNSGFQAINLTLLFGATNIVLIGFDMKLVHGQRYFCKPHPNQIQKPGYDKFSPIFEAAAKRLPPHISIVNATPGSALRAFPMVNLDDYLSDRTRH